MALQLSPNLPYGRTGINSGPPETAVFLVSSLFFPLFFSVEGDALQDDFLLFSLVAYTTPDLLVADRCWTAQILMTDL
tara:strand:- start:392 stop:625 length:234 start_codon:yes stop_codon:yes gene_type:complete